MDRLSSGLERLLIPVASRGRSGAGAPFERYARLAALIAVASLVGFVPSLPIAGVPTDLWLPYSGAVLVAAVLVIVGVMGPRPGSIASVIGALVAASAITILDSYVGPYFHLAPIMFAVVVVVDAIIQGVRASLAMVLVGTIALPFMLDPLGQPKADEFAYAVVYLTALAATVWAYRQLQARSAAALEASETRYRELVERMPGVVYECAPGLEGIWTYISPQIESLLGFGAERFTTDPGFWWARIHPEDREMVAAQEARLEAEAGLERSVTEYRMLDAAGGVRWISDEATLVRAGEGTLWSGILIDVTAEKELEERLRQAQRMEAVGQLAGGIAHDFNNLLTVIRGYGALIRSDLAERGDDTAEVDELVRAAERATALTGQLMTFGRRGVLQPRVLDPAAVIDDLTPMLRRLLGDHVTLIATKPAHRVHVRIDRSQLEQIVVNLAINARDAMPDGGRLAIDVALAEQRDPRGRGRAAEAPVVRIVVSDSGTGMDASVRMHIFEPFFTTKSLGNGTGLGLPTVLGIVNQAGGRISCESAPGRGTAFTIDLPLVDAPGPTPGEDEAVRVPSAPSGGGRVLLVEDQAEVRRVTARMLGSLGYSVVEAAGGVEALMAMAREPNLAILVSDVTMPGMLGPELARRAVEGRPGLPVLLITGYAGEGRAAVDNGPFPVLAKPFDTGALGTAVQAAIEGSRRVQAAT